jgi:hypothetical protein
MRALIPFLFAMLILSPATAQEEKPGYPLPATIVRPFEQFQDVNIARIGFANDKNYILASGWYLEMHYLPNDDNTYMPSSPAITVYDNEGKRLSITQVLTTDHYARDISVTSDRIFLCGRFLPADPEKNFDRKYQDATSEGFVAELTPDLKVKKIVLFPGLVFWKILFHNNSLYLAGEMTRKEVEVNGIKYRSHVEIPKTSPEDDEGDYNDAMLLRLDSELQPEKFGHYAIDGSLQDGEYIIANNKGDVAFALNTVVVRGPDHHEGNLFLVDNNFKMIWHKQYTDLDLGTCHVMPLALNESNEVTAYTISHFALESRNASALPDYTDAEKHKMEIEGIVRYNSDGKLLSKEALPKNNTGAFTYKAFTRKGKKPCLVRFYLSGENNVGGEQYTITPEGKLVLEKAPSFVDPFLFFYTSYSPYLYEWRMVRFKQ